MDQYLHIGWSQLEGVANVYHTFKAIRAEVVVLPTQSSILVSPYTVQQWVTPQQLASLV